MFGYQDKKNEILEVTIPKSAADNIL